MNQSSKALLLPLGAFVLLSGAHCASAQESTTVIEQRGVMGVKSANVFAPKYKQRIKTYTEQIEMGATKGWLTAPEVEQFKKQLADLTTLEAAAEAKGYQKADVDDLDKQFTRFNMDFTAASNKPKPAETTSTAPATKTETSASGGVKSGGTTTGGEAKTSVTTTGAKPVPKGKTATGKSKASAKIQSKSKKP